jgi:membrane protease YdiL (CAAX protease family)
MPARAAWLGLAGVFVGFVLGGVLQVVGLVLFPGSTAAEILLSEVGLWCGLGGTCVVASRRYGTGSLVRDFGWRFRPLDLAYGPLAALACVFAAGLIGTAFHGTRFSGSNTDIITSQRGNSVGVAVVTVIAAVGAPVLEELFFRGFLRTSLASRLGVGAVWAQAVFFGFAHYQFGLGLGNVSVVCATAGIGVVLGYTAHLSRRLGPGTLAHGLFNLFVTLTIIGVIR